MKIDILQENLNQSLSLVSRILSSRPQMPILSNVLLDASSGQLEITASNLETTVITSCGAKVEAPGQFTVGGKAFLEIINGLSPGKLTLEVSNGTIEVCSGHFKAKLAGMPASEFPKVQVDLDKAAIKVKINAKTFLKILGKVVFCVAADESRAVLTGVLFSTNEDKLTMASTDGFRLSVGSVEIPKVKNELKFIVPGKTLNEAMRLLPEKENFELFYLEESNQVVFGFGTHKIISRLISGNFPEYEKIIPPNFSIQTVVSVQELLKPLKLASIFARESANIVKLKIQNSKLKISANAPQVGEDESEVDIETQKGKDEELTIAFNYRYLLDLLTNLGEGELSMEFNGPLASGAFRVTSDPNFLHIIMPVRVQN